MAISFHYDDLVSHTRSIQRQMAKIESHLSDRPTGDTNGGASLKSRSLTFIDAYGYAITSEHADQQSIRSVINHFRRDYVPKYLQRWIQIGTNHPERILAFDDVDLNSFVHQYPHRQTFVAYGSIAVWINEGFDSSFAPMKFSVQLLDSIEKIKSSIQKSQFTSADLELRSSSIQEAQKPTDTHWTEATRLQFTDTIMSHQFYERNHQLLLKFHPDLVKENIRSIFFARKRISLHCVKVSSSNPAGHFRLCVQDLSGVTKNLSVNSGMRIEHLKELIRQRKGGPVGEQHLRMNGRQLEEGKSLLDYGISHPSTIHLVLRPRNGMDLLTGGRQQFNDLSPKNAQAVRNLLQFRVEKLGDHRHFTAVHWQEILLDAQSFLFSISQVLPSTSLLPLSLTHDQHSDLTDTDSDDDVSSDE